VAGVGAVTLALGLVAVVAHWLPLSFYASNVVTMLGLGLGIDYALFVVARMRREARAGLAPQDAVIAAIRHTAPSIAASATTVLIGLVALAVVPADDYMGLGLGGAIVAFTSAAAGMTLLPALGAMMGRWIDAPKALSSRLTGERQIARWESWARAVLRHRGWALAIGVALLLVMATPLTRLKLGQPDLALMPQQVEAIRAVGVYERMGNGGLLLPYQLLVRAPEGESLLTPKRLAALTELTRSLRADARVSRVVALADPDHGAQRLLAGAALLGPDGLKARLPEEAKSLISRDGRTASYHVVLRNRMPFAEAQAFGLELRDTDWAARAPGLGGLEVLVGGPWAFANEMLALSARSFPALCGFILLATWGMLFGLTRSAFLPAKAIAANLLTVAAAWGATYWLFQNPVTAKLLGLAMPLEAVLPAIPLITFCVLFGLSMDYEVFLLSGVMEAHRQGRADDDAIAEGVGASAAVITSGAVIMAIVFIGFALTPMVPIKLLGVSLAIGVLLDATVTRLLVVPALMSLAGRWNWWPTGARRD
jgi:RND superfamily putative drug exporter